MDSFQILSFFHFYFRISPFVNLCNLCILAFVQAPSYMRWIFLFLVPINLTMDLQQGVSMDAPALVGLLFMISLGNEHFLFQGLDVVLSRLLFYVLN